MDDWVEKFLDLLRSFGLQIKLSTEAGTNQKITNYNPLEVMNCIALLGGVATATGGGLTVLLALPADIARGIQIKLVAVINNSGGMYVSSAGYVVMRNDKAYPVATMEEAQVLVRDEFVGVRA